MKNKTESIISIIAVLLVLFTAMIDPKISVGVAVIFLVAIAIYGFKKRAPMKKYLLIVIGSCLVAVITGVWGANQTSTFTEPDEVLITLERTACFGTCPVYTLTIQGDGTVVYDGKEFVKTKGTSETSITQEKIEQLISEFEKVDYFSLNDSYTERTITDAQSVITSITIDGKPKTIEHYHGDFSAPKQLTELEDRIDEIVNSEQWIK